MLTIENKQILSGCTVGTRGTIYELLEPVANTLDFPITNAKLDVYSIVLTPYKSGTNKNKLVVHIERTVNPVNGLYLMGFDGDIGFVATDWLRLRDIKNYTTVLHKISDLLQNVPEHLL